MDRWTEGQMDRRTDGQKDRWTDWHMYRVEHKNIWVDKQANGQIDGLMYRQTRLTGIQTKRLTDIQIVLLKI
jgi:hypothetical protein